MGGKYADGYVDNEVEVWSHSPDCGINIKNTPDSFVDRPGDAFQGNNLYVCGGRRIGTDRMTVIYTVSLTTFGWMVQLNHSIELTTMASENNLNFECLQWGPLWLLLIKMTYIIQ